jgi:hypothetical protein
MNYYRKIFQINIVGLLLNTVFSQGSFGQDSNIQSHPDPLPGKDLTRFDFFYAGEAKTQNMYIVKDGKIAWEFKGPKDQGEISDAVLMTNGNILFAHQRGITLITPESKVLWHYDTPKDCETHTAQPIGKKYVVFVQNGNPAQVFVVNVKNGKTVKNFIIPVKNPGNTHGHFRHARLTADGTLLVSHMDLGKVCEYDVNGKELFSMDAPGIWSVEPLKNGNILLCGSDRWIREVDRQGKVAWDFNLKDYPEYNMTSPQIAVRRDNGNTIINNWFNEWSGKAVDLTNTPVQAIEVTPDKKVVWVLQSWEDPVNLGPSTTIQVLNEKRISENVRFGNFK